MPNSQAGARIIRFPGSRGGASAIRDQKTLLDAVYTIGFLPVAADDLATKRMASRLHILGFFQIEEVDAGGTLRRLLPSQSVRLGTDLPWRVSRPHFARGASGRLEQRPQAL